MQAVAFPVCYTTILGNPIQTLSSAMFVPFSKQPQLTHTKVANIYKQHTNGCGEKNVYSFSNNTIAGVSINTTAPSRL